MIPGHLNLLCPPGVARANFILAITGDGLRPACPPTISAGASRINKRKFTTQNPSCGSGGDVVTARLAGIAAQAEQGEQSRVRFDIHTMGVYSTSTRSLT